MTILSRPVGACGLKRKNCKSDRNCACVAPRRGVWIETIIYSTVDILHHVAPRRGVWIETGQRIN